MKVWSFIKNNKLAAFLLLVIFFILARNNFFKRLSFSPLPPVRTYYEKAPSATYQSEMGDAYSLSAKSGISGPLNEPAPAPEVEERMVIKQSYLSLVVKEVREALTQISQYAREQGGYMVTSSLNSPQESPSGSITVRIPSRKLDSVLEYFRSLSIKVVSENLSGDDITDQYVDIDSRLSTLNKTKARFEEIMDKAVSVQDIMNVQRELLNVQRQIESLKGQQKYLEKSAEMAKVTIYLSTDEMALPYAPSNAWRPAVIFKLAVRSLIGSLRSLASVLIWIVVYSVIWLPILIAILLLRKKIKSDSKL